MYVFIKQLTSLITMMQRLIVLNFSTLEYQTNLVLSIALLLETMIYI